MEEEEKERKERENGRLAGDLPDFRLTGTGTDPDLLKWKGVQGETGFNGKYEHRSEGMQEKGLQQMDGSTAPLPRDEPGPRKAVLPCMSEGTWYEGW